MCVITQPFYIINRSSYVCKASGSLYRHTSPTPLSLQTAFSPLPLELPKLSAAELTSDQDKEASVAEGMEFHPETLCHRRVIQYGFKNFLERGWLCVYEITTQKKIVAVKQMVLH